MSTIETLTLNLTSEACTRLADMREVAKKRAYEASLQRNDFDPLTREAATCAEAMMALLTLGGRVDTSKDGLTIETEQGFVFHVSIKHDGQWSVAA